MQQLILHGVTAVDLTDVKFCPGSPESGPYHIRKIHVTVNGRVFEIHLYPPIPGRREDLMTEQELQAERDSADASDRYLAQPPSGGICPTCKRHNRITNECRCDPNNLPTSVTE